MFGLEVIWSYVISCTFFRDFEKYGRKGQTRGIFITNEDAERSKILVLRKKKIIERESNIALMASSYYFKRCTTNIFF